jgi:sugar-specific transcriptional regulator TrmB
VGSAFENEINRSKLLLANMGLNDYQASALAYLIFLGETKPTILSKVSHVPSARIYGVLDELYKMGLVTVRPGRPLLYSPRPPEEIASALISLNIKELKLKLKILEGYAKDLAEASKKIYLKGKKGLPTVPLLRIVSVGEVSLEETRQLYDSAKEEILIISRAMEYFPEVAENLKKALAKGVSIRIILMKPELLEPNDREKQAIIIEKIKEELEARAELRFAEEIPIRGSVTDPRKEGGAIFLVEDPKVPLFLREAAVTTHPSVVRGLALMFNLIWQYKAEKY